MDDRIDILASMLDKTGALLREVDEHQLRGPTPCAEFDVGELLEHISVWVQVFDGAVNDAPVSFDPSSHRIDRDWADLFGASAESIVSGLRSGGFARPMTMTSDPMPGEFVLNMLLMEYIGHGLDLARATGTASPYSEAEEMVALRAARSIIQPQYRGTGMFDNEVAVPDDADPVTQFVAFLGRDPYWAPT